MFDFSKISPNPLHRRYYLYALGGFAALSLGYLLREQFSQSDALVVLFFGVFPNLLGSFATPFILAFLLERRYPMWKALDRLWVFGLVNLFTFGVCLLIEYGHVVAQLGNWDNNDIFASLVGGLAALALWQLTRSLFPSAAQG